jgi:hypothetical protein
MIATRVSRFAAICAIVLAAPACADWFQKDGPANTSLAGPYACGTATCTDGQLCDHQASGIDAGTAGGGLSCANVARGCAVFDCHGTACSTCVAELCGSYPQLVYLMDLRGRDLSCPAQ